LCQHLLVDDLRFGMASKSVEDLALEPQGVKKKTAILPKQPFAGGERQGESAVIEMLVELARRSASCRWRVLAGRATRRP
jgi:hypothetical protein